MSRLPDLSALCSKNGAAFGFYEPQTERRLITPSRGALAANVEKDGQCLFHCLSMLHIRTFRTHRTTQQVIEDVRRYLNENWDRMAAAHGEKRNKAVYLETIRVRWGGPLEIDAACEIYGVNIFEWLSVDDDPLSTDEKALASAVLSAKYRPKEGTPEELKALPSWDLFLHHNHFRYLETTTSERIHAAAAQPVERRLPERAASRGRVPTMNKKLGQLAAGRAERARGVPAANDVCHAGPIANPGEEASLRLVSLLVARDEQEKEDAVLAREMARGL